MARTDLFLGRPWVICRDHETPAEALALVEDVALEVGASPIEMTPADHDAAVALVSHLPQVVSSALAARLVSAKDQAIGLAGQGLRDVTRIASSDPELWVQILAANKDSVADLIAEVIDDLQQFTHALKNTDAPGAKKQIASFIADGNRGVSRIPGKHGSAERFATLTAIIDDRPGQIAKLLTDIGDLGINMEDLQLEHSPGAQIGFAQVALLPEVAEKAAQDLAERGWRIL